MSLIADLIVPFTGLVVLSLGVAFLVRRKTNRTWFAAFVGGTVIPAAWLLDGIIWLGDMAVDDPPPGMIIIGYAFGSPLILLLCSAVCFGFLRLFKAEN